MDRGLHILAIQVRGHMVVNARRHVGHKEAARDGLLAQAIDERMRVANSTQELLRVANVIQNIIGIEVAERIALVKVIKTENAMSLVVSGERIAEVVIHARRRVADQETLEIALRETRRILLLGVEDDLGQCGQIVARIRLTCQDELVLGELRELGEPALQDTVVIMGSHRIVVRGGTRHVGEAYLGGAFDVDHVCESIPRVGIVDQVSVSIRIGKAIFTKKT